VRDVFATGSHAATAALRRSINPDC